MCPIHTITLVSMRMIESREEILGAIPFKMYVLGAIPSSTSPPEVCRRCGTHWLEEDREKSRMGGVCSWPLPSRKSDAACKAWNEWSRITEEYCSSVSSSFFLSECPHATMHQAERRKLSLEWAGPPGNLNVMFLLAQCLLRWSLISQSRPWLVHSL